ncbi:hypothetical protein [Psychroserpens sp. MEBiC05023]
MKTVFKISRVLNVLALVCLIGGPWGIILTGFLQVLAAIVFLIVFPKNLLIYIYFAVVGLFFLVWNQKLDTWLFAIPLSLIFYLTYIIHYSKSIKLLNS